MKCLPWPDTVFLFLPYLFAVGVALGLSNQAGQAGLAALAGIVIYDQVTRNFGDGTVQPASLIELYSVHLPVECIIGSKASNCPKSCNFSADQGLFCLSSDSVRLFFLLYVMACSGSAHGLNSIATWEYSLGGFGLFIYGVLYRVLVAFGLHHLLNNVFWFQLGTYETPSGNIVQGDLPRFFAGDPSAGFSWLDSFRL